MTSMQPRPKDKNEQEERPGPSKKGSYYQYKECFA